MGKTKARYLPRMDELIMITPGDRIAWISSKDVKRLQLTILLLYFQALAKGAQGSKFDQIPGDRWTYSPIYFKKHIQTSWLKSLFWHSWYPVPIPAWPYAEASANRLEAVGPPSPILKSNKNYKAKAQKKSIRPFVQWNCVSKVASAKFSRSLRAVLYVVTEIK